VLRRRAQDVRVRRAAQSSRLSRLHECTAAPGQREPRRGERTETTRRGLARLCSSTQLAMSAMFSPFRRGAAFIVRPTSHSLLVPEASSES